jgi:hypothetical protein
VHRTSFSFFLIALLGALASRPSSAAENSHPEANAFRFETIDGRSLRLKEGEHAVFVYNYGDITNANAPTARSHTSYFHPIYGVDGEVLTGDFPKDHVYHRGLYWAWSHMKIAGQEHDFWSMRGIRLQFQRWLAQETKPNLAALGVENAWLVGDKVVMREKLWTKIHHASEQSRSIDIELAWTPTDQPVTLWGAEGKSYGGFTLRFGPRTKTLVTVPSGRASEDLLMTKLPWADFSADFDRNSGRLSGIALFVHPEHPDYPPTWMTRDYGMLAVGWPGVTAQTLQPGKETVVRYRLWIHRGNPGANEIQRVYEGYCAEVKP